MIDISISDEIVTPPLIARVKRAREELNYMLSWLPAKVTHFVDIGCGPGITSIMLARRLKARVYLLDGNHGTRQHGYHSGTMPWADVELTRKIAVDNLEFSQYVIAEPDPDATYPCDFIMSLLSWGHHYPIDLYLPFALRSLSSEGRMILDLRRGRNGLAQLEAAGFRSLKIIAVTEKLDRHVLERIN